MFVFFGGGMNEYVGRWYIKWEWNEYVGRCPTLLHTPFQGSAVVMSGLFSHALTSLTSHLSVTVQASILSHTIFSKTAATILRAGKSN